MLKVLMPAFRIPEILNLVDKHAVVVYELKFQRGITDEDIAALYVSVCYFILK